MSRNSASSRAIPVEKMIRMVQENPYVPWHWGKNQKGMVAEQEVSAEQAEQATEVWLAARDAAVFRARLLLEQGIHKQITNRLLEPFMWHTVIVTATEWDNFLNLRCHPAAHPDIRRIAELMRISLAESKPKTMLDGDWHLPYITQDDEFDLETLRKISVGRCARVSYLTHDGKRDPQKDIELHDRLLTDGHMSPFEHQAAPLEFPYEWSGNFRGWLQYRKTIPFESNILGA